MEGSGPTESFISHDSQGVLIAGITWLSEKLFGGHVARSSRWILCRERDHALDNYRETKIA